MKTVNTPAEALLSRLSKQIEDGKIMFGHQDSFLYGHSWKIASDATDFNKTDIEDVVTESEIEDVTPVETTPTVIKTKADRDREAIEEALKASGGNRKVAADMLGISERTLYRKLRVEN
jgi:DNA-binding NtrC family response regulator